MEEGRSEHAAAHSRHNTAHNTQHRVTPSTDCYATRRVTTFSRLFWAWAYRSVDTDARKQHLLIKSTTFSIYCSSNCCKYVRRLKQNHSSYAIHRLLRHTRLTRRRKSICVSFLCVESSKTHFWKVGFQAFCACTRFLCMHKILVHAQKSCACTKSLKTHFSEMGLGRLDT